MLKKIKALFEQPEAAATVNDNQVQLAAATLMFEMIRSDGTVDEVEVQQLRHVLIEHFSIDLDDVDALINDAQVEAEEAISLQGFTRQICAHWNNQQRQELLEYLWVLALADEHIDAHERHLVRKIAGLLYMTDRQINIAKQAAQLKLGLN